MRTSSSCNQRRSHLHPCPHEKPRRSETADPIDGRELRGTLQTTLKQALKRYLTPDVSQEFSERAPSMAFSMASL
jgi:hypothetical protein